MTPFPPPMRTSYLEAPKDAIPALSHLFLAAATPINDVLNSKESDPLSATARQGLQ